MKSIKKFYAFINKHIEIQVAILFVVMVLGIIMVNNAKSQVDYVDMNCPNCGSDEVGNFGHDSHRDWTHAHCFSCSSEFYIQDDYLK